LFIEKEVNETQASKSLDLEEVFYKNDDAYEKFDFVDLPHEVPVKEEMKEPVIEA
jgi:hypothetical protein